MWVIVAPEASDLCNEGVSDPAECGLEGSRRCREVVVGSAGARAARHVGIPCRVQRDSGAPVESAAAEIGREDKLGAVGIELYHEGVLFAAEDGLERVRGRRERELDRGGKAGHVGVAVSVHRDAGATVYPFGTEESGVDERLLAQRRRIELRDESTAAAENRLERPRGRREVIRGGNARHVGVAERVHRDSSPAIGGTADTAAEE